MRYFLMVSIAAVLVCMSGCRESRVNATTTVIKGSGTSVYPIEKLFELDGCNIYRFSDADRVSHFSTCPRAECPPVVCPTPEPKSHRRLQGEDEVK